jgi:preprotein translocase subunit SecY
VNPGSVANIARVPELNRRILFTFAMLGVYRLGCAIPTPGIDAAEVRSFFADAGGVFDLVNLFTGGALEQLSIFALGIMPYISASIILQLLTVVIPRLAELKKEGEEGRRVVTRYTRYLTVCLALLQGFLMATALESGIFGARTVMDPGLAFRLMTMITLTAGTSFIMWLGEQITERGIGNGISLVIFSGIVVTIPSALTNLWDLIRTGQLEPIGAVLLLGVMMLIVGGIVHFERSQRRIPIQYARRVVGRQVVGGGMSYFPLKLNVAGVIPPIFASSLLLMPTQFGTWAGTSATADFLADYFAPASLLYNSVYVGLIIFFAYFYTGVMIDPDDVAENIKKNGGYIPGIRPGQRTANYIHRILNRTTAIGAVYLATVCILPVLLAQQFNVPFYFGGTALLIVVGVALDTVSQVEAHLVSRSYDSFVQGVRIRGRGGR